MVGPCRCPPLLAMDRDDQFAAAGVVTVFAKVNSLPDP